MPGSCKPAKRAAAAALAGVAALLASACASAPAQAPAAQALFDTARLQQTRARLDSFGDADSQAAAALIERVVLVQQGEDRAQANDAAVMRMARAAATAPARPDLPLLQLRLCTLSAHCDWRAVEAHLRGADPDNGVPWLYTLAQASTAHDAPALAAALHGLAQTGRVDLYWNSLLTHLTRATAAHGVYDAAASVELITGMIAALPISGWRELSQACAPAQLASLQRLQDCRAAAQAFRRGDSTLAEGYGLSLAHTLWPADSPQQREIAAAKRVLEYREIQIGQSDLLGKDLLAQPRATLALYSTYRTEQQVERAALVRAGLSPEPPPNWSYHVPTACSTGCAATCATLRATRRE